MAGGLEGGTIGGGVRDGHFRIFMYGGAEFLLDVADAVYAGLATECMAMERRGGFNKRAGFADVEFILADVVSGCGREALTESTRPCHISKRK